MRDNSKSVLLLLVLNFFIPSSVTQTVNSEVKPKPELKEEKKKKTWNIRLVCVQAVGKCIILLNTMQKLDFLMHAFEFLPVSMMLPKQ